MRFVLFLGALLLPLSGAFAQVSPKAHEGVYLRGQLGLGFAHARSPIQDVTFEGKTGALNLELGYAVFTNFILYGKFFGAFVPSPEFDIRITGPTLANMLPPGDRVYAALGAGVLYYFERVNVYVSAAAVINSLRFLDVPEDAFGKDGQSSRGTGLHLGLGKEWWVNERMSLGVGVEVALGRIRGRPSLRNHWDATLVILAGSVAFSAG